MGCVGIIANPMAGRDVRRLVSRATSMTRETKRDQVARAAIGAAAGGASRILVCAEPFRISSSAVENLDVGAQIDVLDIGARLDAGDTARAVDAMRDAGCGAVVVFGGDGTNHSVARAWCDAPLVAVSTGTNNVFPTALDGTVAGAAAGLVASGQLDLGEVSARAKAVRVEIEAAPEDLALIDAAFLVDDRVGNLLPFDPEKIRRVVLARAEPAAVGISPIGGLLLPCGVVDRYGVEVTCVSAHTHPMPEGVRPLLVPISPGLYRTVHVASVRRLPLSERVTVTGPGILAFDGDRVHTLQGGQSAELRVVQDGPRVIDAPLALRLAAQRGLYLDRGPWHDGFDEATDLDCC